MFDIILYQPEIPPNTGNVIRLCANTGCRLHLIEPIGFEIDDKRLRRAGLDYHEFASVEVHRDLGSCIASSSGSVYAFSTRGVTEYSRISYKPGDRLLFGPETRGLPDGVLSEIGRDNVLRIPMTGNSRSLNLSNTVAVITYEALRQNGFDGLV